VKIDVTKTINEIFECEDVESLRTFKSDIDAVSSSLKVQIERLQATSIVVLKENDRTQKLDKSSTELSLQDSDLIAPADKIKVLSEKIHAFHPEDYSLSFPTLTTEHIENGKLRRPACLNFFQWLIFVNGGAVRLKRYHKTLRLWTTSSKLEADFSTSTIGSWNSTWKKQEHLTSIPNASGLYTMTNREFRKAKNDNPFLKAELSKSQLSLSEQIKDIPFPISAVKSDALGDL